MKFLPKMPQRILGIELQRELLLSGKNHGGLAQTLNSKAINEELSTFNCSWLLHEFDGRAVWIADVYDPLSRVRTRQKRLGFTGSFPTVRGDGAQNRVEIIDDESDMYETDVAWPQTDMPFMLGRREIFE